MMLFTFAHVLMKTVASSLILCVDGSWLLIYMGGDMLVFLLLKFARRDFTYWPNLPPVVSAYTSLTVRITQKVLTDFTLTLHMRNSFEMGGILFILLVIQNQAFTFAAAQLYLTRYEDDNDNKIPAMHLWALLFSLLGLFLGSCSVFVLLMDRRYLETFVNTTTGPQSSVKKFKLATTDEQRLSTFKYHRYYYAAIEVELKLLLAENWEDWMFNRPDWLTDSMIATIPDEFLPSKEVEKRNNSIGARGQTWNNSVGNFFINGD
jgi:hypothetical protein